MLVQSRVMIHHGVSNEQLREVRSSFLNSLMFKPAIWIFLAPLSQGDGLDLTFLLSIKISKEVLQSQSPHDIREVEKVQTKGS